MNGSGVEVHDLSKTFDKQPVVSRLSLSIERGEFVSLLGPSGCGKTTALRLIAGLEAPDSGTVTISGTTVRSGAIDLPAEKRSIGMVFQSYAVWPHLTVLENVAYPLRFRPNVRTSNSTATTCAAKEVLELVHLGGLDARLPHTLSGGQQQRVALARALVARPSLLLFDEPLSNLDAKLREEMRHEIRELVKRIGITSLYVTHDQPEAFAVSDRIAVMQNGTLGQLASPDVLYREPKNLPIAEFVGKLSTLRPAIRASEREVLVGGAFLVRSSFSPGSEVHGKALVVGVRPEDVEVAANTESGIQGLVRRSTFLGDRTELVVETPFGDLRVDVTSSPKPTAGDAVGLRIKHARAFPAAPNHSE